MLGEVVGMAASICVKDNVGPRDVYRTHLDKLTTMMQAGVPTPTYHAYGCDESESYHFKDRGFIHLNPPTANPPIDPALKARIKALDVQEKKSTCCFRCSTCSMPKNVEPSTRQRRPFKSYVFREGSKNRRILRFHRVGMTLATVASQPIVLIEIGHGLRLSKPATSQKPVESETVR